MKPTVLQLIDSFHQGGSERQAIQLTRLLCETGRFTVRLASLSPEGKLRPAVEELGLGDIPSFPLTSFYDRNALQQLRRLSGFMRSARVNVLHTHDFYTNVFGMLAGTFSRIPVRIASMRETTGMRTPVQQKTQQFAYSLAHQVVANSEAVRKKLIDFGVKDSKVSLIYNGLDAHRFEQFGSREELLELLALQKEVDGLRPRFVAIVANMRHHVKDYPMFLRAAKLISEQVPDAKFLLAGEGELTAELMAFAKQLGIEQHTHFLGRCDDVGTLLQVSDVCVLSSKAEGFSNSILEYMAAARPVVATNVGGAGEAIIEGETGFLVESGDYVKMAERIIQLLRDPEKARVMGERGRSIVEAKFSCEAQLARTEELYGRLLTKQ